MGFLNQADPEISHVLHMEARRQSETINLIASENYTTKAIIEAHGSFLTDKYAEGYPHHRHYGGCENIDEIENLALERLKKLYNQVINIKWYACCQNIIFVSNLLCSAPTEYYKSIRLLKCGSFTHE